MKNLDIYHKRIIDGLKNIEDSSESGFSLRQFAFYIGLDHPQKLSNRLNQLETEGYIEMNENGIYRVIKDYLSEMLRIPYYGWSQCGNAVSSVLEEVPKDVFEFDRDVLGIEESDNVSMLFITKAKGTSMMPRIKEDDLVLIKEETVIPNEYDSYFVIHNGDAKIKKIQSNGNRLFLISTNSSQHQPFEIDPFDDDVRIIGTVKKVITTS